MSKHTRLLPLLPEAFLASLVYERLKEHPTWMVLVTPDTASVTRLQHAFAAYGPTSPQPLVFPDWEVLPYDPFSPHPDITATRLSTLFELQHQRSGILLVSIQTLLHQIPPPGFVAGASIRLKVGQHLPLSTFQSQLITAGYHAVSEVVTAGEFAIRGSMMDLFPMGKAHPVRIDWFDNEIERLRYFNADDQRSIDKEGTLEAIDLISAREFSLTDTHVQRFRQAWRSRFESESMRSPIYQNISKGRTTQGIEFYLPFFFEEPLVTLFDYLPPNSHLFRLGALSDQAEHFSKEIKTRYEEYRHDVLRPLLPPSELFIPVEQCFKRFQSFELTDCTDRQKPDETLQIEVLPDVAVDGRSDQPLAKLQRLLAQHPGRVLITALSLGRQESLATLFQRHQMPLTAYPSIPDFLDANTPFGIMVADLSAGFTWLNHPSGRVTVLPEVALFGDVVVQHRRKRRPDSIEQTLQSLSELQKGDPVVHLDHGIGRYMGLTTLDIGGISSEFVHLEYADNDKLYVPVTALHLITRYSAMNGQVLRLNRLGGPEWEKSKKRALEKTKDIAAELLAIHAERAARKGFRYTYPKEDYDRFAMEFPFEITDDQQTAIQAVLTDMESERPMDRLICGDVGFGKTEVAMRAAFIAATAGKQVAVLVPTTLLAQQHHETFRDRFSGWPFHIEVLSRFKSPKESAEVLTKLQNGSVDIVIGTHKLLGKNVQFHQLGLIIIDEEHRFGVEHKEKFKSLRANVDVLTLTATPIPRTLNMALSSIRDLSIIATPPLKRLSILTFVRESNPLLIKEAILRELLRGGQVYYLHNSVDTIERCQMKLQELVPEAKIAIAHGQMPERMLERIMADFYHQRYNILLCTTIIETGIDVPTANTIIIERADKFGLAQLHQLRGRVGRSHHQAYAYLLTPFEAKITGDAEKRLEAIEQLDDLGAGFMLASQDLEIRGAGEILGDAQSGQVENIGFALYMDLLDRTIRSMQQGKVLSDLRVDEPRCEINSHLPCLLPENYVFDVHTRLVLYKRLSGLKSEELESFQEELIDRFGPLPQPVLFLMRQRTLQLRAEPLGIKKIDLSASGIRCEFFQHTKVDPGRIIVLIQTAPKRYVFQAPNVLHERRTLELDQTRFDALDEFLSVLCK